MTVDTVLSAIEFYPPLVNPTPQGLYAATTWTEETSPPRWLVPGHGECQPDHTRRCRYRYRHIACEAGDQRPHPRQRSRRKLRPGQMSFSRRTQTVRSASACTRAAKTGPKHARPPASRAAATTTCMRGNSKRRSCWPPSRLTSATAGTPPTTCRALVAAADSADEDKALGVKLMVDIRQVLAEKNVPVLAVHRIGDGVAAHRGVAVGRGRAESQQTGVPAAGVRRQAAAQPGRERPRICAGSILGRFAQYTRQNPSEMSEPQVKHHV